MENKATILEKSLLVLWNERDASKRLEIMKEIYTEDITFFESNEREAIIGYEDINKVIAGLQLQWPLSFRFELNRPSAKNHNVQHISWNLGNAGEKPVASGMDVAIMEGNKIKSLHLMLDNPE